MSLPPAPLWHHVILLMSTAVPLATFNLERFKILHVKIDTQTQNETLKMYNTSIFQTVLFEPKEIVLWRHPQTSSIQHPAGNCADWTLMINTICISIYIYCYCSILMFICTYTYLSSYQQLSCWKDASFLPYLGKGSLFSFESMLVLDFLEQKKHICFTCGTCRIRLPSHVTLFTYKLRDFFSSFEGYRSYLVV